MTSGFKNANSRKRSETLSNLKKTVEKRGSIQQARYFLDRQSINVVSFDASQGVLAASILPQTSPYGLSFADRACLSLGMKLQYKVYTAEQRMGETELDVKVKLIRKRTALV